MDFLKTRSFLFSAAIIMTFFLVMGIYTTEKKSEFVSAQKLLRHTNNKISQTLLISQKMASLISQQRGYLLTRDDTLLKSYTSSKNNILETLDVLGKNKNNDKSQNIRIQQLQNLFDDLIEKSEALIQGTEFHFQNAQDMQEVEDHLLRTLGDILNEEYEFLQLQVDRMKTIQTSLFIGMFVGFISMGLVLFILNYYLYQSRKYGVITANRLQYALMASGEGVYDWDIESGKVYFSKTFTEMLGYSQKEFGDDGEAFAKKIVPEDRNLVKQTIKKFLDNELSEYSIEFRMFHKSGYTVWINSRAQILRDKDYKPKHMIGTHRNICRQKMIEENLKENVAEAKHSSDAKSDFLAHMSHEIRTPLTAITGIAEILYKNSINFDKRQQELISTLLTSTKSLRELVTDILDFSKIEKGEIEFDEQFFPLSELIGEITSMLSVAANERNIEFKIIDDDVKNIHYFGDKTYLRQILINLIGNAIKFTEEGKVTLLIKKETVKNIDVLNFYVQDTGIGIDANMHKHIFEKFKQADSSVSRKYGGTGLGLPISKNLANLMGGDISLESTKGLGSVFTLSLPMKGGKEIQDKNIDPKLRQKINDSLSSAIRDEQTALIAEDYDGNVVILSYLMEEIGLPFDVARNGQEALSMWRKKHYDIVLMDVQMPVMDGLTATQEIRKIEAENNFNPVPIIGITAHALVQDKNKCIDVGMTDYLPKPIDSDQLKRKILHYIQKGNVITLKKTTTQ